MLLLIIPVLLIILEGIFTASETGLVSIENIKVLQAVREKKRWAERTKYFLTKPERFFSTILVCENIILVIAATLFAKFFIDLIGEHGAVVSTCIITFVSVTVGQFVPKSFALSNPTRTMSLLSSIIYYIEVITNPVVSLYAHMSRAIARLFRGATESDSIRRFDIVYAMSEYEAEC
jgi:Mg2+/Co2+ transporter CorB